MVTRQKKFKLWLSVVFVLAIILAFGGILASCGPSAPTLNPKAQIEAAVAATVASIPTYTPYPVPTPIPFPTPYSLAGVFCEYEFCIGHPTDLYLMDDGARRSPPIPSTYGYGILFSYSQTIFIEIAWTTSGPAFDSQLAMRYILEETEKLQGNLDALLIGDLNVYYQPITTASSLLTYGGIASWQCGGRDFVWKVYTPQDGMASALLKQAIDKFRCEGQ